MVLMGLLQDFPLRSSSYVLNCIKLNSLYALDVRKGRMELCHVEVDVVVLLTVKWIKWIVCTHCQTYFQQIVGTHCQTYCKNSARHDFRVVWKQAFCTVVFLSKRVNLEEHVFNIAHGRHITRH